VSVVVLTGGVFQNALLSARAADALERRGFTVLLHRLVPCNDGGLALGQAYVASLQAACGAERTAEEVACA
jgi:hydrogenase maturation protein HypF